MNTSTGNAYDPYLQEWRHWPLELTEQPLVLQTLTAGTSNRSFLIGTQDRQWVLRVHQPNPLFDCDRQAELAIQQAVNGIKLAPCVDYQDPEHRYRVTEYIPGKPLSQTANDSEQNQHTLRALCQTIKRFHRIPTPPTLPNFSYTQHLTRYFAYLADKHATRASHYQRKHQQLLALCQQYEQHYGNGHRALCHHDLNPDNILLTSTAHRPQFIMLDWEFAGAGIASMDFAGLAVELDTDIKEMSALCEINEKELTLAATIYRYLCELYWLASKPS